MSDNRTYIRPVRVRGTIQFADILRACRQTSRISAAMLAKRLRISLAGLYLRENGERGVRVGDAAGALELLGYALVVMPIQDAPDDTPTPFTKVIER